MNKALLNAIKVAALVLLAMWITSVAANNMSERTYAKHEKRVLEFARRKEMQADSLTAYADSVARQRDSLAVVASEKQKVVTKRIETVRLVQIPDTCQSLVAQYDSIVVEQQDIIGNLNWALRDSRTVEQKLRESNRLLDERGDSLQAHILRPKKKPSRLALAAFGGQCVGMNGTGPCIGVGLSWRIF
jgi:uncharacterized coiled-coil protein SlyX